MPLVSVLMPTYKHEAFIERALESLLAQELADWELLIVDDGSPDNTAERVEPFLADARIRYRRLPENVGLGAALNLALDDAQGEFIAYLPSDDVYYAAHLRTLAETLAAHPAAVLAHSGVRDNYNRTSPDTAPGFALQPVQVMHRKTAARWLERKELVTDDMERMIWAKLRAEGDFVNTGQITCEWVSHPRQRHKIVREPVGGIMPYRQYYNVKGPLRFHTTVGNFTDEEKQYAQYVNRPDTPPAADGLKILLVGELAYNADRVLALEELGHRLYGLWMEEPYWYNAVGPLAFGHVTDLPRDNWQQAIRDLQPDVIYALLNWQAVPFCHEVMKGNPGVPFVWHYKEGPFISLEKGHWREMVDLYREADGVIYCSEEMQLWTETVIPTIKGDGRPTMIFDGDLPKRDWFTGERTPRLSAQDGELHTVVPGRPIGLHPHTVEELGKEGVHLHFYGDFTQGQWKEWIEKARRLAPNHLHLHANVSQDRWLAEFSRYDAGWLHFFKSENYGEIRRSNWDDLNIPARLATLAVSGLPQLQGDNTGHTVATQTVVRQLDTGFFFKDMHELAEQLRDAARLAEVQEKTWRQRQLFTFDHHAPALVEFFRRVIASC
jgi:glycosyltransferase involved in cell wall biosynthesis